ncbi:protein of unknown function [Filimonas lacunae]|uniref:DUF5007 domain-containing protein n=1 Tax=Filimonas lacunae TaxID=477680 RepID=A0A173MDS4_9BACT|nr:DUF5007 domain-containing protein [Filimonas lacunae]BAV05734.1 hypothetical protein FLA_1746 [Filimonas lacunae]SIT28759.1 protein of unknown function [Filimonas lacunae]
MKRYILALFIITGSLVACSKIVPGFLSNTLGYTGKEIICKRGLVYQASDKINYDGSTPPVTFALLNLRDSATGKAAPVEFTTLYEVMQFKPGLSFNIATDTTVDILNAKRQLNKIPPYNFNTTSGQIVFNRGTKNLPVGMYNFDIEATNANGTKFYPSAGFIHVMDPTDDDMFTLSSTFANAFDDITAATTAMKTPKISFTKQSDDGSSVILKITDKNGVPFNPLKGEVIKRGDRPYFPTYAKFHPIVFTDTAMVCNFELAPFPLSTYVDNTGYSWGYLQYYRIPSSYVAIDGMPSTTGYSANPVFAFKINLEGTYVVEVKLTDAVHK